MTLYQKILVGYVIAINIIAYVMMCFDKYQSKKKGQRISENTLFILAFILGAVGIYMGMKMPLYHKSAKPKFKWGIPLLVVFNVFMVYFIVTSKFISLK